MDERRVGALSAWGCLAPVLRVLEDADFFSSSRDVLFISPIIHLHLAGWLIGVAFLSHLIGRRFDGNKGDRAQEAQATLVGGFLFGLLMLHWYLLYQPAYAMHTESSFNLATWIDRCGARGVGDDGVDANVASHHPWDAWVRKRRRGFGLGALGPIHVHTLGSGERKCVRRSDVLAGLGGAWDSSGGLCRVASVRSRGRRTTSPHGSQRRCAPGRNQPEAVGG